MPNVDLHFHLLPGVDDGPSELGESLELARAAVADGSSVVVATPHVRPDLGLTDAVEVHERVLELRRALSEAAIPLDVRCGGELGHEMVARMGQRELQLLAHGPPGRRWVLVETPFHGIGADFHAATAELRDRGFGVLVAHPERSADASLDGSAGLVSVIASDAHGPTRPPALGLARRTLIDVGLTAAAADALIDRTPRHLLAHGIPARSAVAA
jgi:protein-tyrosine phosphatase